MKTKFSFLCLMFGLILNINAQIPTDGLVDYWPFNGNANDETDSLPTHQRTTCLWFEAETLTTRPTLLGYGGRGSPGTSWWMNLNHGGTLAYFLGFHYSQSNYLFLIMK